MELLYAAVIGAGIGLLLRYVLPGRSAYGVLLLPALGAAATCVVWAGLTWLGLLTEWTWLVWLASLAAATIVPLVVALVVSRRRIAWDAEQQHLISTGRI